MQGGKSISKSKSKGLINQSIDVSFVINMVTARRIVLTMEAMVVLLFKLQWHPMKMVMRVRVH